MSVAGVQTDNDVNKLGLGKICARFAIILYYVTCGFNYNTIIVLLSPSVPMCVPMCVCVCACVAFSYVTVALSRGTELSII